MDHIVKGGTRWTDKDFVEISITCMYQIQEAKNHIHGASYNEIVMRLCDPTKPLYPGAPCLGTESAHKLSTILCSN